MEKVQEFCDFPPHSSVPLSYEAQVTDRLYCRITIYVMACSIRLVSTSPHGSQFKHVTEMKQILYLGYGCFALLPSQSLLGPFLSDTPISVSVRPSLNRRNCPPNSIINVQQQEAR